MPNFAKTLGKRVDEVKRPPNIPLGTYRVRVDKAATMDETSDGKWQTISIPMKLVEATDEVDQEDLEKFGGVSSPMARISRRFMFGTEDTPEQEASNARTEYNLVQCLRDHLRSEGTTVQELLANALNQECYATVTYRADKNDPEIQYAEVRKTAPLE